MLSANIDKKKRFRAPNFTREEVRLLLKLALTEKHILENKKTDSETWKLKEKTWQNIANSFNAASGQIFRTAETLRQKYDCMKKDLKKKVIRNKTETMKTGGGKPDYIIIDGPEKELLEVLSLSINGLPAVYDSDSGLTQTSVTGEILMEEDLIKDIITLPITEDEIEIYDPPVIVASTSYEKPAQLTNQIVVKKTEEKQNEMGEGTSVEKNGEETRVRSQSWKNWSPASLRSKKHSALTPKKSGREIHNRKMDCVLELREEYLRLQIHHVKQEEQRAQEKHEKEMKLLELEILLKTKNLEK